MTMICNNNQGLIYECFRDFMVSTIRTTCLEAAIHPNNRGKRMRQETDENAVKLSCLTVCENVVSYKTLISLQLGYELILRFG